MIIFLRKSQLALFDAPVHVAASVRKDGTVVKPHTRIQKIALHKPKEQARQASLFDEPAAAKPATPRTLDLFADQPPPHDERASKLDALSARVGRYASGLSRARDFSAASFAGHAVGVDVGQLSENAMHALADAVVNRGTPVFIDSGAYSLFRAREKKVAAGDDVEPLDFQQVLDRYDRFTELLAEKNEAEEELPRPILVMPDVMGDQAGSLAELKKHAKWINVECSFDVARPLVPMPKGDMSLTAYYDAAVTTIGTDRFIVGIPAVSGAWSPEQVTAFLRDRKPRAVHFLGALHDSRLTKWLQAVVAAGVDDKIEVTADACPLKSAILPRDGSKLGPGERAEKIVDKLGVRARADELENVIAHHGGVDGVRKMLAAADFEQQQRFIGLIADLSGKPQVDVRAEYGLGDGPVEGDAKTENGVEYVLRNGRWHRTSPDEVAAAAPAPAAEAGPWLHGSERLVLMACGKKKKDGTHPASQLYTGALGGVLNKWAPKGDARPDIAIVSAKHGLVHGDVQIESYDQQMTPARSKELAATPADLAPFQGRVYKDVFIAGGADYRRVADEYVKQLRAAGIIAPDAEVHSTRGEIGEIKSQFGQYLRSISSAPVPSDSGVIADAPTAPAAPVSSVIAPPAPGTPFGVAAGTTKPRRREINSAVIAALETDQPDPALLRQYSGNGGCGDSLNEYYTDPDIAAAMWTALGALGFRAGTALEPSCATGVFLHTAPAGVRVTGVELDPVSAQVAQVLHGARHEIVTGSLERFATTDERQFDVVIGNPPYGPRGKFVKDDKKQFSDAEQYFTDTALDKCKPGGLVALVVPTGIMDSKTNRSLREQMLRKGEFLGAQRMPNTAFEHSHTEVTTDVIYLRKRADDVAGALDTVDQATLQQLGVWDEEFLAGSYFTGRGADNVLGTMTEGWRAKAGMGNDITVEGSMVGVPEAIAAFTPDGQGTALSMQQVLDALPDEDVRARAVSGAARRPYQNMAKVGDTKVVDGISYVLQGDPPRWHRVDEFMQTDAIADAAPIAAEIEQLFAGGTVDRPALEAAVRAYVEKHGIPADDPNLMTAAAVDKTLYRLIGAVNRQGELSDAVLGRAPRKVEGGFDATAQLMAIESGEFTVADLAARLGRQVDEVEEQLAADSRYAFVAGDRWTTMDTYLTGELWPKLDAARAALAAGGSDLGTKLQAQVEQLEKAIDPKSLDDVDFQINSAFLPLEVIQSYFDWRNHERDGANEWTKKLPPTVITFANGVYSITGGNQYGDTKLLDKYLNRSGVRKEEDLPKIEDWNAEFKEWLCGSVYRDQVEDLYNRAFRGYVAPVWSDAPIDVPGLNPDRSVRDWRWSSLRRSLAQGKGIIADDVGLGKTLGGLLLARMSKVQGRAQRPIIVVPKSVLANWYAEAQAWFPGSRVMTIGANFQMKDGELVGKDDSAAERKRKYHDMTQNDYDFIVISEPAFEELDLDPVTKEEYYGQDFWVQRGESMGNAGDKRRKAIRERYEQAIAGREFQDRTDAIWFNDLGIDMLIADEMHHQKNLYAARARFGESPKFLGGQGLSNRALDFNLKTRWVREQNKGLGVFGLTATPTKNSPLEVYSMLSHIAPEAFERIHVRNSEEFLDRFCEFQQDKVLSTTGDIEDALVVSGFKNLTELREIMSRYIDRRTAEQVGLQLPQRQDRMHLVDMTDAQQAVYADLRELAEKSAGKRDATGDAHIFAIMDKMNKAALDLELLDPAAHAGATSPKYAKLAEQCAEGKKEGGQIVFSEYVDSHEKIASALVAAGFDRKRIGIINAKVAGSAVKRQNIADAFNAGKLDAVIGNCTMAEGLNLQKTTTDIHALDIPWEPATVQQRNGRGLRQGNLNEAVRIHSYLSRGSFDGYRYQAVAAKKDWQDLLWNGGDRVENLAREGAFSLDDMRIMLAADPEAARAKFADDKAAAMQRYEAGQRLDAVAEYVRFQDMQRSYKSLKNKASASATRLRDKLHATKTALFNNKYFPAKEALDSDTDILIHPDTGTVLTAGKGMDFAADGKMVVTGVNMRAGTVTMRRYADTAGARHVTVPLKEFGDANPFDVDAAAEAGEVRAKMEEAAAASLNSLEKWDDVKNMPSAVLEANHDLIQRQIKEGVKAYKFSMPFGARPMVHKETGDISMAESYEQNKMHDTHDYLLPTDAAKEKAIQAWMTARRDATIGSEHLSGKRGKSTSRAARVYKGTSYNSRHKNPVTSLLNEMSGGTTSYGISSPLVKEAKARLETEQMDRIRHADNISDAVRAILPLAKVEGSNDSYGDSGHIAKYPKKALTMLWARARHLGALNHPMEDAAGVDHHAYAVGRHRKSSVHNALVAMAIASGHRDLAEAMVESGIRHNKNNIDAETVRVLGHGYGNSARHLEQLLHHADEAGVADMTLGQLREYNLSGPFAPPGYSGASYSSVMGSANKKLRDVLTEQIGIARNLKEAA